MRFPYLSLRLTLELFEGLGGSFESKATHNPNSAPLFNGNFPPPAEMIFGVIPSL